MSEKLSPDERKKQALALRKQCYSYKEIAAKLGISVSTVSKDLKGIRLSILDFNFLRKPNK